MRTNFIDWLQVFRPTVYQRRIEVRGFLVARRGEHVLRCLHDQAVRSPFRGLLDGRIHFESFRFDSIFMLPVARGDVLWRKGNEEHGGDQLVHDIDCARVVEHRCHGVVIGRWDGIELVIVAARAPQRQAHQRAACGVELFVGDVVQHLRLVLFGERFLAECDEAGGDDAFGVDVAWFIGGKQVAGDLEAHHSIERHVFVEGVDHPVAVPVGIWVEIVVIVARGIGVTGYVQPVATPSFSIAWGGQQAVHYGSEGGSGLVGEKSFDLFAIGRHPG